MIQTGYVSLYLVPNGSQAAGYLLPRTISYKPERFINIITLQLRCIALEHKVNSKGKQVLLIPNTLIFLLCHLSYLCICLIIYEKLQATLQIQVSY